MSIHHFYILGLGFFAGVFISTLFPFNLPTITWFLFLSLISLLIWSRFHSVQGMSGYLFFGLCLVAFSLGALRVDFANQTFGDSILEQKVGQKVQLSGEVVVAPDVRESVTYLEVQTEQDKVLVAVDRYSAVSYGDIVVVEGKLTRPENFETDLGRVFNYSGYLKVKGIEYRLSFANVEVIEKGAGNPFVSTLLSFKSAFMEKLETSITEPAAGLGEGVLLGVKQALGEELETAFRKTGIIHIVVLSGYNIMLVVVFVMYILGHFFGPKTRVALGTLAIVAFALLVGLSATVVRASVMAALLLIVQVTGRIYLALRGLMLAGILMLIINPLLLVYDVGFQLSFLATLGLILLSPHFEMIVKKVPNFLGVRSFLVATISTQIAVSPLLLYQIGEFSLISVVVNVLVLPMVPVAMLLTFITGLTAFVSPSLALLFSYPTYFSLTYISEMAWWFAKLPFAAYTVPNFPFPFVLLAYLLFAIILWRWNRTSDIFMGIGQNKDNLMPVVDSLKDWEITEEVALEDGKKQKVAGRSPATLSSDTPIFFR